MKKLSLLLTLTFPLLFALQSETFIDSKTGLQWQDDKSTQEVKKRWNEALLYCGNLEYLNHKDWRLPSQDELVDLYTKERSLVNLASSRYWSSTEYVEETSRAAYVGFYDGHVGHSGKSSRIYIRCVRNNQ